MKRPEKPGDEARALCIRCGSERAVLVRRGLETDRLRCAKCGAEFLWEFPEARDDRPPGPG